MAAFAAPPKPPSPFTFTAVEPRYEIYGWHVDLQRPVLEFSRLEDARPGGFTLAGSGTATVTTPPRYRAGRAYEVTVGGRTASVPADDAGRLRVEVPLGPANTEQQYRPGVDTKVYRVPVSITAGACSSRRVVTLRVPAGAQRIAVLVDGRRRGTARAVRSRVTVPLTGLPRETARVQLVVTLRGGRTARFDRRFRTCVPS